MTEELGRKISDAINNLMMKEFPNVGFMIVGTDDESDTMLVTGNACAVCITKGLIMEIMHGRIKHLDGHSDENIMVIDMSDTGIKH